MAPLTHAPATVIRLHGDLKGLGTRNTLDELGAYPEEWSPLLAQVFDEYSVVIAEWSAEWDYALVAAIESTSMFTEFLSSLHALERLADPPLSTAMAVTRLERYLPNRVRRIDLHDLVMRTVDEVLAEIAAQPTNATGQVTYELLQETREAHFRAMAQLAALLTTKVWHDDRGAHDRLWLGVLQRLVDTALVLPTSGFDEVPLKTRRFPALTSLAVMSVAAIRRGRYGLLIKLATRIEGRDRIGADERMPAAQLPHYRRLAGPGLGQQAVALGERWPYPTSHGLVTELRLYFADVIAVRKELVQAYRDFDYRVGLTQERTRGYHAIDGEYVGECVWDGDVPRTENAMHRELARSGSGGWPDYSEGTDKLKEALVARCDVSVHYQRCG